MNKKQQKYIDEWKKANQDKIILIARKGTKDILKERANKDGKSLSRYMLDCSDYYEQTKTIKSEQLGKTPIPDKEQTNVEKPTPKGLTYNRHE